jgi:hypothetical protein
MVAVKHSKLVSFVHGYGDDVLVEQGPKPALACLVNGKRPEFFKFTFPRNVEEFENLEYEIEGEKPLDNAKNFDTLPRFGFTGLSSTETHIFAGSWNGVYKLTKKNLSVEAFVTNRLMNDLHGIFVNDQLIVTVLTGKDTIVLSDHHGKIRKTIKIKQDLSVEYNEKDLLQYDWRFLSKQFRGATGIFHFNYVQLFDDVLWLTSRNIGAFIVLKIGENQARIRTINHKTPVCLHDGVLVEDEFLFTSIDGKILLVSDPTKTGYNPREKIDNVEYFQRDLVSEVIRLNETELNYYPNWCRGIAKTSEGYAVTIDGRYDTDLSFKVLEINKRGKILSLNRIEWSEISKADGIRYVTGFDIELL